MHGISHARSILYAIRQPSRREKKKKATQLNIKLERSQGLGEFPNVWLIQQSNECSRKIPNHFY